MFCSFLDQNSQSPVLPTTFHVLKFCWDELIQGNPSAQLKKWSHVKCMTNLTSVSITILPSDTPEQLGLKCTAKWVALFCFGKLSLGVMDQTYHASPMNAGQNLVNLIFKDFSCQKIAIKKEIYFMSIMNSAKKVKHTTTTNIKMSCLINALIEAFNIITPLISLQSSMEQDMFCSFLDQNSYSPLLQTTFHVSYKAIHQHSYRNDLM